MTRERLRLFVALELPDPAKDALMSWSTEAQRERPELRVAPREALHVTLCFLGAQAQSEVEAIGAACSQLSVSPAPQLDVGAALWLPRRSRPRILAARLRDERARLTEMQRMLSRLLNDGGWYFPEGRQFLPHVTVARIGSAIPSPAYIPAPRAVSFRGEHVTLFCSRLSPQGARYEKLSSVALNRGRSRPGGSAS